jgi:hypothetical protein
VLASAAISNGRVVVVTTEAIYAFGSKKPAAPWRPAPVAATPAPAGARPAYLAVTPTELNLKPGERVQLTARLYDGKGHLLGTAKSATWALNGMAGQVTADGKLTAGSAASAGLITAAADGVTGTGRGRVLPVLPIEENFDFRNPGPPPAHWINTTGKYEIRELDGSKVLVKLADNPFTKRARSFLGHTGEADYTVEADIRATERRRQMGDAGVVAQRYQLTLFGNHQRLELQPWQPETARTVAKEFPWKKDTWYRLRLRVDNLPGGQTRARGKAWPAAGPEPAEWTIERVDPIGNPMGAPGIYADAPFEVTFDNIKVTKNQ